MVFLLRSPFTYHQLLEALLQDPGRLKSEKHKIGPDLSSHGNTQVLAINHLGLTKTIDERHKY